MNCRSPQKQTIDKIVNPFHPLSIFLRQGDQQGPLHSRGENNDVEDPVRATRSSAAARQEARHGHEDGHHVPMMEFVLGAKIVG